MVFGQKKDGEADNLPVGAAADNIAEQNESFALEPLESQAAAEAAAAAVRRPRKRRLIVDEQKNVSGEEMKANMSDFK